MLWTSLSPGESVARDSQPSRTDEEMPAARKHVPAGRKAIDATAPGTAWARSEPYRGGLLSERGRLGEDAVPRGFRDGLSRSAPARSRGFSRDSGTHTTTHGFVSLQCADRFSRIPADPRAA